MTEQSQSGYERRQFIRLDYVTPLAYKVCKEETLSKLLQGYTCNISQAGLLCTIRMKVSAGDILWLAFDRGTLGICTDLEKRTFVYQNGIIGKVIRVEAKGQDTYSVGIQFFTREEPNITNIYPQIHFLEEHDKKEHPKA